MQMPEQAVAAARALARSGALAAMPGVLAGRRLQNARPAAVRIERSRVRSGDALADQTALTVWFGNGPDLPGPSLRGAAGRVALRGLVGMLGAAAIGVAGVMAARGEAARLGASRGEAARLGAARQVPAPRIDA